MEVDSRGAVAVRGENSFQCCDVVHMGGAFIVNHDVVAFGVVGVAVDFEGWAGGVVIRVYLVYDHMRSRFYSLFENFLLRCVGVAAAAGYQERFEGLDLFVVMSLEGQGQGKEQSCGSELTD